MRIFIVLGMALVIGLMDLTQAKAEVCGLWQINAKYDDCSDWSAACLVFSLDCECMSTELSVWFTCMPNQVDCGTKPCSADWIFDYKVYHCNPDCCGEQNPITLYYNNHSCQLCK